MDAAEYKHVALGLIFLKYISDRFEERRAEALADPEAADLAEDRDLYIGENVFWVPEKARWDFLKDERDQRRPDHRRADRSGDDRARGTRTPASRAC